jgi:hypothetical protein
LVGRHREIYAPGDVEFERPVGYAEVVCSWTPTPLPSVLVPVAEAALAQLEGFLAPADEGWILSRVLVLFSHYPDRRFTPEIEEAIAADWAEDLAGYPRWAIDQAARSYRRNPDNRWRPTPGVFLALVDELIGSAPRERDRLRQVLALGPPEPAIDQPTRKARPERRPPSAAELAAVSEMMQKIRDNSAAAQREEADRRASWVRFRRARLAEAWSETGMTSPATQQRAEDALRREFHATVGPG